MQPRRGPARVVTVGLLPQVKCGAEPVLVHRPGVVMAVRKESRSRIRSPRRVGSAAAGRDVSKHTTHRLWIRTEDNPFFLRELVGLLASEQRLDQPDTVPVPVREVVLRRIARLPEAAAAVLSVAAVAGRCFDALVVAEAASVEVDAALEAIDAAVAVGLAVEYEQRLGWFRSRTRSSPTPPSPCLAPSCSPRWVFNPIAATSPPRCNSPRGSMWPYCSGLSASPLYCRTAWRSLLRCLRPPSRRRPGQQPAHDLRQPERAGSESGIRYADPFEAAGVHGYHYLADLDGNFIGLFGGPAVQ
jgi:hypothetical protein